VRRPLRARPTGSHGELQIAPLIDAVFLLLTYFLFTISLSTVEGLLPSELAVGRSFEEQRAPAEAPAREVVVRIVDAGGSVAYFVDDWPVEGWARVAERIDRMDPETTLVIDADPNVAYEHVVRLYNHALAAGLHRVVFPISSLRAPGAAPRS